jgi:hypothetical protein
VIHLAFAPPGKLVKTKIFGAAACRRRQWSRLAYSVLALAVVGCASEDGASHLHTFGAEGVPGQASNDNPTASAGGANSDGPSGGTVGAGVAGAAGGGAPGASGTLGGMGGGGVAATASGGAAAIGGGGAPATGGGGATAIGGGGAGGSATTADQLLSVGKPSTADSEQTGQNPATYGNDGSISTRWCAADGGTGHHWQVDLGASHSLTRLHISWEKAANYQFKIEGSPDGNAWSMLLDETATTGNQAEQDYLFGTDASAEFVRITVTGLESSATWASFFEFSVYGK